MGKLNPIRNEEMKEYFSKLSETVCLLLQEKQKTGFPLYTIRKKRAIWESFGTIVQGCYEYDFVEYLKRHMSQIRKMTEFNECMTAIREDVVVNEHLENCVGGFTNASILQTPMVVELFLTHLISELKGLEFEESIFLRVYQMMEDFFYNDTIDVEIFAHLEGFVSDAEHLDLGNGWEISRIPQVQFDSLLSEGLLEDSPNMSRYGLYWKLVTPKVILKNNEELKSPKKYQNYEGAVRRIVSTLRLFKSGDVGYRRIIRQFKGWLSQAKGMSKSYMKPFWGNYSLDVSELDDFRTLLALMNSYPENPPFVMAMKRLNDAVERQHPYDSLIDIMIAFEALLSYKKEGSKKSVVPKRVASLIALDTPEWKSIVEYMKSAYDLRNSIAHGDTESEIGEVLRGMDQSRRNFVSLIGDYLRRVMKSYLSYLSKGCTKRDITKMLEEEIRERGG